MARPVDPERAARRREAVVAVAAQMFAEGGYERTSVAQIARAAGVSAGTVFYHFGDKAAVFRAIFEADRPAAEASVARAAGAPDPLAGLLAFLDEQVADAGSPYAAGLVIELLRRAGEDPQLLEVVEGTGALLREGLAALLVRAAEEGRIDTLGDPEAAAAWLLSIADAAFLNGGEGRDVSADMRRTALGYLRAVEPAPEAGGGGEASRRDSPGGRTPAGDSSVRSDAGVRLGEEGNGNV
ncbi:TetR/AcrR family transcriptional regulator [Brevibacterium album]|uniref:TetR/AcrR family transcriptional regulator n=1 Tax=Brevibacterium album TaxID=417948 RepID=UPI000416080E|nr:TetR/AcrR family transcriptional regulator [Brevibacterium album]